jgi:hypothetical protein
MALDKPVEARCHGGNPVNTSKLARLGAGAALGSILIAACGPLDSSAPPDPVEETAGAAAADTAPYTGPLRADGLMPGMVPFRSGPKITSTPICASPQLSYFGGPILQSPAIVAVFWTGSVNATLQANIGQFYSDVTVSSYWSWLHEYDTVGLTPGTNQAFLPGTFAGNFTIAPLKCAPGGNNCHLNDNDLQAELTRQINLGVLPAPTLDCTGNAQTIYMIDLPPNISLSAPGGSGNSCVANGFCAYHFTGTYGPSNIPLIYGVHMDVFSGPCASGCRVNPTALGDATSLHAHELTEAVTDPDVGLDVQANYAYPAGWGDNFNNCGEIADICADGNPGDTFTVAGRTWVVQQLWSNQQNKCTSTGPASTICSGTTTTGCRRCSCGDDGQGCSGAHPVCETSSSNVLHGACEQCTATSGTCPGGTCQQSTTPAQDDLCVGSCVPLTTCPAGDNCGVVGDGCGGTITCGSCTAPQSCGGGGVPNHCGCAPLTTCPAGDNCGTVPNGCGGTITCGSCTAPQVCGGGTPGNPNKCGCTPATTCPAGDNCGTVPNGCGGTINCGSCMPPQTCGTPTNPNQCGGCVPLTTCPAGDNCGTVPNGCGGTINCGSCAAPQTCGGGTPGNPNKCGCTPVATCPAGFTCGTAPDGCGGTINCGSCAAPQTCGGGTPGSPNKCGCTPKTACPAGDNCGTVPDGCGGTVSCGSCAAPQTCGGGTPGNPNVCGCTPAKICPAGVTCGTAPDGCGGTVACGGCTAPQTCGGGGNPGACGCTAKTTCPAGFDCGVAGDGCGGTLSCGTCAAPQTCGGAGNPNACGCTPATACPVGFDCGTAADGCGGLLECGSCLAPQTCGGGGNPNACGCTAATACPAGLNCGTVPDGCGGLVACGVCAAPQLCGGGLPGQPNVCGCTPSDACPPGAQCGTVPDGCGGVLPCGACAANQVCDGNQCVDPLPDGGPSTSSSSTSSTSSSTSSSSSTGGTGGAPPSGATFPLYGRATCSAPAAPAPSGGTAAAVLSLLGFGALRRRRSGRRG